MACRRRDRRNFIGCNIGVVANRGCGRGCCPFPDDELFAESHATISPGTSYWPNDTDKATLAAAGRTDLRWQSCGSLHHRPKFVCPKPQCRRIFKPFVDEEKFEYSITRAGWAVRYRPEHNADLEYAIQQRYRRSERADELRGRFYATEDGEMGSYGKGIEICRRTKNKASDEAGDATIYTPQTSVHEDEVEPLSSDELAELLRLDPELWWQDITRSGEDHQKRCPSCGGQGTRVGSNFRAPRKSDDRGWNEIVMQVEAGTDMNAAYVYCMTVDDFNERVAERSRLAGAERGGWEMEKRRRLESLGLVVTP